MAGVGELEEDLSSVALITPPHAMILILVHDFVALVVRTVP